jgi:hypothetical protein
MTVTVRRPIAGRYTLTDNAGRAAEVLVLRGTGLRADVTAQRGSVRSGVYDLGGGRVLHLLPSGGAVESQAESRITVDGRAELFVPRAVRRTAA